MTRLPNPAELNLIPPTDTRLNRVAEEVTAEELKSDFIQGVIDRMFHLAGGKGHTKEDSRQMVGLAAVQLGVNKRIIMIDMTADGSNKEQHLKVFVNPIIVFRPGGMVDGREGCWSCGEICGNVPRHKAVTLIGLDRTGAPQEDDFNGFGARIVQHEDEHLEGRRFPDSIPADQPERLHLVKPEQFDDYRTQWQHWPILCPRETWEAMKAGLPATAP